MTVIGLMLGWLGLGVFVWAMVGLIWPALARLPNRASAVKLGALSVAILVLGGVIRPPTEAELAERRAAAEAREDARVERAAAEAAEEAAAREAEAAAVAERERADAAAQEAEAAEKAAAEAAEEAAAAERERAAEVSKSAAGILTSLARPSRRERDITLRRFQFVLPRIVRSCTDMITETNVGDLIAVAHRLLTEAGLEREDGGYLGIANRLHRMSSEVSTLMGGPFDCNGMAAMYITTRNGGFSIEESEDAALVLYRLVQ